MRLASSNRPVSDLDRSLFAVLAIFVVLSVSLVPHFGFVPAGPNHQVRLQHSHAKQQSLADDALQWTVPAAQFSAVVPLLVLPGILHSEVWSYASHSHSAQLYNRPPPSA